MSFQAIDYLKAGLDGGRVAWQQANAMFAELYSPAAALTESGIPQTEATVASAATTDIGAAAALKVQITGTTTITSLGTVANKLRWVRFTAALTLTHNATSLILPGAANITTAAGDTALFSSDASGNWRCHAYQIAANEPQRLRTKVVSFTRDLSVAAGSQAITGVGFKPTSVLFVASGASTAAQPWAVGFADQNRSGGTLMANSTGANFQATANALGFGNTATASQTAVVASYDTDGFTLTWSKVGSPTGTMTIYALCSR